MEEARKAWVRAGASSIHRRCNQASKEAKQQANIPRAAHLQSLSPVRSSLCATTTTGTALATRWLRVRTTAMSCFPVSFRATNCNLTEPTSSQKLPKKLLKELQISSPPRPQIPKPMAICWPIETQASLQFKTILFW
jgi:hypothetical protein